MISQDQHVCKHVHEEKQKNQKQIYYDSCIALLRHYDILPNEYDVINQIGDESISDTQYKTNMDKIVDKYIHKQESLQRNKTRFD